jgi:hypothetical protein
MIEAKIEREIADGREAQPLQEAILSAVRAYADFLDDHGLIWEYRPDPEPPRLKALALVVSLDFGTGGDIDLSLKDGALDRVYGDGVNPDPWGRDADPAPASST